MATRRDRTVGVIVATWAIALSACGAGEEEGDDFVDCAQETRDDEFVAGMAKAGETWSFRLMDSEPAPPDLGDNDWALRVEDEQGAGVPGLDLIVTPMMADHDHGTVVEAVITDEGGGDYRAAPVNMWMRGLWLVTVDAARDGESDSAVFAFCVQN